MKRNINIDLLKFISILAVVMTHVNAEMLDYQVHSMTWTYGVFINTVIKFCVPVFLMCTGAVMINDTKTDIKKLYSKYILRFITALVFWNGAYQILNQYYLIKMNMINEYKFSEIFISLLAGTTKYHLYFMYIIIICYMFLPFTKKLINAIDEKEYRYLLVLIFITSVVIPYIFSFYAPESKNFIRKFSLNICYMGIGYMIYGKYIYMKKEKINIKWALGLIILFLLFITYDVFRRSSSETFVKYWEVITPFIFIYSCLVFSVGIKLKLNISEKMQHFITFLSKGSFFVYLSHLVVLDFLRFNGLSVMKCSTSLMKFIYPPGVTLLLVLICYIFYFILSKIPVVNKYIM